MRSIHRFLKHWQNWVAVILVLFFVFIAVAAPLLSPNGPKSTGYTILEPKPPSAQAPLGTLPHQIDVYHALVWGTRDAMRFGLLVAISAACIGIMFGSVAGYAGGAVNRLMMRVADAFLTFPIIAGVVMLQQLYLNTIYTSGGMMMDLYAGISIQPSVQSPIQVLLQHVNPLTLSLILFTWMPYARLINALVIGLKQTEYVVAAHAIGARPSRILFRHILPNAIPPAIVIVARDVGSLVILQATLTFIGVGGNSTWGNLLAQGRDWIIGPGGNVLAYWWVFIPATLAVILFGITWNLLGDGLSELLDPHNS